MMQQSFSKAQLSVKKLMDYAEKGYKSGQIFKADPALVKARDDLAKNLQAQIKTAGSGAETAAGGAGAGTLGAEAKAPKIEGDRLAKIGLFIGNGGPALDYARRTAVAVEKIAAQKYTGGHPYMTEQEAVFAI